jgi:hypothetical protein
LSSTRRLVSFDWFRKPAETGTNQLFGAGDLSHAFHPIPIRNRLGFVLAGLVRRHLLSPLGAPVRKVLTVTSKAQLANEPNQKIYSHVFTAECWIGKMARLVSMSARRNTSFGRPVSERQQTTAFTYNSTGAS